MQSEIDVGNPPPMLGDGIGVTLPSFAFCEGGRRFRYCRAPVKFACLLPFVGDGLVWGWACGRHARAYGPEAKVRLAAPAARPGGS